ncbi:HPP family protein [Leptospira mayottensis]|uniref:CBS domain protein n=2 Tax=Leptospira mayottensis TaxID=1137606 RepID=A0AA87MTG7_9LEPT|nr:CBS domain-containing protein [Leptospira mayottensis]AXR60404.1 CBS domain-containing protein [Leptospira mayottensis]AXR64217.1 CBS domain-containing protein [Leptospira mayottensis]AZQ03170.1 CBS domain-containing protein [Leptospira mayottensis 200901116]EKS02204.1 CBS domain protein [Leptospira mayottensis 200901122]TGN09233.1 CBS domain-containing protein [Leptospira mayottensis]
MFFWVTRGISEVYIPPVQPEIIRRLHSIAPSPLVKKPESEQDTERKNRTKKVGEEISAEYKTSSSLGNIRHGDSISFLTAKDLMTSPVVGFLESDPISRAQDIFIQKRFRHVPVLDGENTLCGIISDRDWMRWKLEHISEVELGKTIGKIMKTRVLSVRIQAGIGEIAKVLFEERIGCLPVINDSFQVIGIITRSDVLRAILRINEREFLA